MTTEARIEIANKVKELIEDHVAKACVWSKGDHVRIYMKKGYLDIKRADMTIEANRIYMKEANKIIPILCKAGFAYRDRDTYWTGTNEKANKVLAGMCDYDYDGLE